MRVLSVRSKRLFFIVRLIVYSLKIIGLAPFSVSIGKSAEINPREYRIRAFFSSKFGLVYNILLVITIIISMPLLTPNLFSKVDPHKFPIPNILFAIWIAKIVLFVFTSCLVIIHWAFRQEDAATIMNRLLEVDVLLSELTKRPFYKRALIFLVIHGILSACTWTYFWVVTIGYFDVEVSTEFFCRIPDYVVYWFVFEYVTTVGLVSRDLQTVNKYLLDFNEFGNYLSRPPVRYINVLPVGSVSTHSRSQIASLKLLRSLRTTLSELCDDIADFFSLPILFSIASCFVTIFEALYNISQMTGTYSPGFIACLTALFVAKYIYPVVSLTLNVTRARKEAEQTGQIIHKLLAVARTEEIKNELGQFSLQLLHEKVNFTAYGFFTLDSTLLQSMLAGAASYAIILIQFGSSVCNCNCNCKDTSTGE